MYTFVTRVEFNGFCLDLRIVSCGRSPAPINSCYLEGTIVSVPADHFLWANRVRDEVVYVWNGTSIVPSDIKLDPLLPKPGCVVVVLESPHRSEYRVGPFEPIGPLRDPLSRNRLHEYLPRVLSKIGGIEKDTDIVICNPVPYQTSMDRIMVGYQKLQSPIRNAVWKALYTKGFQKDFESRITAYKPSVILNACTGGKSKWGLKETVRKTLIHLRAVEGVNSFRLITCSHHPSIWLVEPNFVEEKWFLSRICGCPSVPGVCQVCGIRPL